MKQRFPRLQAEQRGKNWAASPEHRRDPCTLLNCSDTHPPALQLNGERKNPQHLLEGREMKGHLLTESETPTHTVPLLPVTNIKHGANKKLSNEKSDIFP